VLALLSLLYIMSVFRRSLSPFIPLSGRGGTHRRNRIFFQPALAVLLLLYIMSLIFFLGQGRLVKKLGAQWP